MLALFLTATLGSQQGYPYSLMDHEGRAAAAPRGGNLVYDPNNIQSLAGWDYEGRAAAEPRGGNLGRAAAAPRYTVNGDSGFVAAAPTVQRRPNRPTQRPPLEEYPSGSGPGYIADAMQSYDPMFTIDWNRILDPKNLPGYAGRAAAEPRFVWVPELEDGGRSERMRDLDSTDERLLDVQDLARELLATMRGGVPEPRISGPKPPTVQRRPVRTTQRPPLEADLDSTEYDSDKCEPSRPQQCVNWDKLMKDDDCNGHDYYKEFMDAMEKYATANPSAGWDDAFGTQVKLDDRGEEKFCIAGMEFAMALQICPKKGAGPYSKLYKLLQNAQLDIHCPPD